MTTPIDWPAELPGFLWDGYQVSPRTGNLQEKVGAMTSRSRIYSKTNEVINVSCVLPAGKEQAFRTFYRTDLYRGTLWFNARILANGEVGSREVMFIGQPPTLTAITPTLVRMNATLLTRSSLTTPADPVIESIWNEADRSPDEVDSTVTLSEDALTATLFQSAATVPWVRASLAQSTGKYYFEVLFDRDDTDNEDYAIGIGLVIGSVDPPAASASDILIYVRNEFDGQDDFVGPDGPEISIGVGLTHDDYFMFAVDIDAGKVWVGKNGTWASGDPAAGTSPTYEGTLPAGPLYPFVQGGSDVAGGRLYVGGFTAANIVVAIPIGFLAWDGTA